MKSLFKWSFICFIIFPIAKSFGQFESFPCKCCNSELKHLFKGEVLKNLYVHNCKGAGLHELSSSFLMPSGTPPKIIGDPNEGPPNDAEYVKWTCRYSVGSLTDNDPKTAWVEGVDGPGIGEVLIVPCLDLKKPVKIWAGYGKSDAIFKANNRPKVLRLVIVRAEKYGAPQNGYIYEKLKVIAEGKITLEDKNNYQSLQIPAYTPETYYSQRFNEDTEYMYFLGFEIVDVYQGTKFDDTCISEVTNL
jgi:hypothetical protein